MTSIAPGSASRIGNEHYKTDEEFLFACADAMREEYKAIVDAGLILQIDDPAIAENWDQINPEPTVEEYRKFTMLRVEALNHALRGLPQGSHPLPPLLGQLARPAHDRHPDARHRRRDARDRRRRLFVRGRQRAPRARMERSGRTSSCPTTS